MTKSLPLLVVKKILFKPTINPTGLIIFRLPDLNILNTSVILIIFPVILSNTKK